MQHEWLEGCEYVNPYQIAQEKFGDWNSPEAVASAARQATDLRYKYLAESKSLALETVFSSQEKLVFLSQAMEVGYFVRLFFVGTDSPVVNVARIGRRVLAGGHEVPIAKVISRYQKSILNLTKVLPLIDRGYVYDNSVEGVLPEIQFRTSNGQVKRAYQSDHDWSNQVRQQLAINQ